MTTKPIPLWQRPMRAFVWTTDTCDANGEPSLAKLLALVFGICVLHDCWQRGFTALNVTAAGLVLSAAFGRSVFMNWLDRNTSTSSHSSNTDVAAVLEVLAKRDAERGIDPA